MQYLRLTAALIAAATAFAGCSGSKAPSAPAPLNVDVASARRTNIATYVTLDGQVAPLEQSTLAFQQSATITDIYVNVGDRVRAGQVLARIDDSTLRAQLAQARASANQQSATAQGARVGLPVQIQQNDAALTTAKAALANAKLVYQQNVQLFKQGYVSAAALESARAAYVQAQSTYQNTVIGLRNNQVSQEGVNASVAGAVAAAANSSLLRTEVAQTALYAPFDGVITQRLMDPGSFASPSQPVLAISRVDTVWVNINVPDEDLAFIHPGDPVTFTSNSLPGKSFAGHVGTVNAVPTQGTLSYLARFEMRNPADILRGGMLVAATLTKSRADEAIVVPAAAVAQNPNGSGSVVYVVGPGNTAKEVPVRLGVQTDTLTQVFSPKIQPGTNVITTRPDALKDGSVVAVNSPGPSNNQGGTSQQ